MKGGDTMQQDIAYGPITRAHPARPLGVVAGLRLAALRAGRFLRVLGAELARIPDYHDEAERLARALRRANGAAGRDLWLDPEIAEITMRE